MDNKYKSLFTPWKIGNCEIKNRIVLTSMGGTSIFGWMKPSHFSQTSARFLLDVAKNNAGLILPGIQMIKDMIGGRWLYKGKGKFNKLKTFMDEVHRTGCKMFVQLTAGFGRSLSLNKLLISLLENKAFGTLLKPIINADFLTASASETPNRWYESLKSRPLTENEIEKIIDAFGKASLLLKNSGVDGVEVHAVHEGYLLDQFATKYTNYRTDKYGGSLENRLRFATEIVKTIKKYCGNDFPVSLRYSVISKTKGFQSGALPGEKYNEVGRDMEESIQAAKILIDAGYDMLNCDNGTYDAWYWAHPPGYMPENCNLEDVIELRKHVKVPVVCAGRMTVDAAAKAIDNKQIDAMGVARQFLADPEWITKLIEGRTKEIRPCICCHSACFNFAHYKGVGNDQTMADLKGMSRCAVNAETMQYKKHYIKKTTKPKKVAIIGGGIGGMETARVLKLRGHDPEIFEKTNKLGGVFVAAANPDFKEKDRDLLKWYENEMKRLDIKVNFNNEIKNLSDLNSFDNIVVAIGSTPKKPSIPGVDNAIDALDYLRDNDLVGKKVAVIGGGLSGCEIALDLFNKKKEPIIIESKNDLMAVRGISLANSSFLRDFFKLHKIPVYLESNVKSIEKNKIIIIDKNGKEEAIDVDSTILAVGYNPNKKFACQPKCKYVGDCVSVGNLRTVIWNAWDVAMKI